MPVEQGIGSKGNETINHFRAIKDAELRGYEPPRSYDKSVAEIWARDPKRAKAIGLVQPRPPAAAKKA